MCGGGGVLGIRHRNFARSSSFTLNREKSAFAHYSSRHVKSSLRYDFISSLGARLFRSFRYAQSQKAGFRSRRMPPFPSTRTTVNHWPVDGGEEPHPRLRFVLAFSLKREKSAIARRRVPPSPQVLCNGTKYVAHTKISKV